MHPRALAMSAFVVVLCGAMRLAGADAAVDPTTAEPVAADVPMAAYPERVVDYTLRATLDPALHTVHGEGTIA